jgi:hypothetical protein
MEKPYESIQHAIHSIFSSLGRQTSAEVRASVEKHAYATQELVISVLPIVSRKLNEAGTAALDLGELQAQVRAELPAVVPGPWIDLATQCAFCILTGLGEPAKPEATAA